MANLKRLFGLREMAVNVPDKDVPALSRVIKAGVNSKILPPEAKGWVTGGLERPAPEPKKAQAVGKKDVGYDPKLATRSSKPSTATPKPADADLEDDWFQDDDEPKAQATDASDDEFPSYPGSLAHQAQNAPVITKGTDDDEHAPMFNAHAYGGGHSSWDDVPDWMRDPEKMPAPGDAPRGASLSVPRSRPEDDDVGTVPGKLPKARRGSVPSPVGRPWSAKDVKGMPDEPRKPGVLSRLFGRKK